MIIGIMWKVQNEARWYLHKLLHIITKNFKNPRTFNLITQKYLRIPLKEGLNLQPTLGCCPGNLGAPATHYWKLASPPNLLLVHVPSMYITCKYRFNLTLKNHSVAQQEHISCSTPVPNHPLPFHSLGDLHLHIMWCLHPHHLLAWLIIFVHMQYYPWCT